MRNTIANTNCESNRDGYSHSHSYCYCDTDRNSYGYTYGDRYANSDADTETCSDAKAAPNSAASPVSGCWQR